MTAPALEPHGAATRFSRVAFTGKLASMSRRVAGDIVRARGGHVTTDVSRRTSLLVVGIGGWPLLADGSVSRKLARAEVLRKSGAPIQIVSEEVFLEQAGVTPPRALPPKNYSFEQVCELLHLSSEMLERWETHGLIRSVEGRYDFQDIVSLRTIAELTARGVTPARISATVRGLSSVLPDAARPLAQLSLVEQSGALLAEVEGALLEPDGQLVIDFAPDDDTEAAEPLTLTTSPSTDDTEAWFERALALEENEQFDEAAEAYRRVLANTPRAPEVHFNLGNVLRSQGRFDAAEEHFLLAVAQHPGFAAAWYNLADLQEERGRVDDAIHNLEQAIAVSPGYADAHYNLALCLETAGRRDDARRQWQSYLALDPESPWADEARTHL